jgi:hypothetical protein
MQEDLQSTRRALAEACGERDELRRKLAEAHRERDEMQRALNASRSEFQQLKQRMVEVQGYLQHLNNRQDLLEAAPPTRVVNAPPLPRRPNWKRIVAFDKRKSKDFLDALALARRRGGADTAAAAPPAASPDVNAPPAGDGSVHVAAVPAALTTGSQASSRREIREQSSIQKQIVERMKEQAEEAERQGAEARRQASLEVGNAKQALLEKAANKQAAAESFRQTQLREERKLEAMAAAAVPTLSEREVAATGSVARDGAAGTSTAPAPDRPSADPVAVGGKRRAGARDGAAGTSTVPAPAHPSADPPAVDGKRKRREPRYDVPPIVGKHCSFCRQSDCAQGGSLHQCKAVNCMRLWSDRCIARYAGDDDQKRCFHHAKCSHHELTNCPECVQNCMPTLYEPFD